VDVVRILKTQDANYIRTQVSAEENVGVGSRHNLRLSGVNR
jgi:hypothetical protein